MCSFGILTRCFQRFFLRRPPKATSSKTKTTTPEDHENVVVVPHMILQNGVVCNEVHRSSLRVICYVLNTIHPGHAPDRHREQCSGVTSGYLRSSLRMAPDSQLIPSSIPCPLSALLAMMLGPGVCRSSADNWCGSEFSESCR